MDNLIHSLTGAALGWLLAAGVPADAQTDEAPPQYSLVAVGDASTMQSTIRPDCGDAICVDNVSFGGFEAARTLAGPDLGTHFGAAIMVHGFIRSEPMLVVVARYADESMRVVAWGRWNPEDKTACIDRRELDALGFDPAGEGIFETERGTCARFESAARPLPVVTVPVQAFEPQELRQPTVAIIEFERPARYVGEPRVCPGASPDDDPAEVICMASLYQERARVLRHISGPRLPARFRLRTTAHSSYVLLSPGVAIAVQVRPFEGDGTRGYFANWWQPEDENGRICLEEDVVAQLGAERAFRSGRREHQDNPTTGETTWSRCIRT